MDQCEGAFLYSVVRDQFPRIPQFPPCILRVLYLMALTFFFLFFYYSILFFSFLNMHIYGIKRNPCTLINYASTVNCH